MIDVYARTFMIATRLDAVESVHGPRRSGRVARLAARAGAVAAMVMDRLPAEGVSEKRRLPRRRATPGRSDVAGWEIARRGRSFAAAERVHVDRDLGDVLGTQPAAETPA